MIQHPVTDKLLARMGDVVVSFALLESKFQSLAGSLIFEHQQIGQIITVELSFPRLRAMTVSLYLARHGEDADAETLRALMARAAELEGARNQLVHSVWGAGNTPETVTRIKGTAKEKRGIHWEFKQVGEADIAAIADDMKRLASDVQQFLIHLLETNKAINSPLLPFWGPDA